MLESEIHRNSEDVEKLDTEINDFKMQKVVFRYKMKELYLNLMKSPSEIR